MNMRLRKHGAAAPNLCQQEADLNHLEDHNDPPSSGTESNTNDESSQDVLHKEDVIGPSFMAASETSDEVRLCHRCSVLDFEAAIQPNGFELISGVGDNGYLDAQRNPVPDCRLCRFLVEAATYSGPPFGSSELSGYVRYNVIFLNWRSQMSIAITPQSKSSSGRWIHGLQMEPESIDYMALRQWISDCVENHATTCAMTRPLHLRNLQVIDCESKTIVPYPGCGVKYVALSYVWGDFKDDLTETSSPSSKLPPHPPKVVEDSIIVTKELGYRYLWVDRYCIPQTNDGESAAVRDHQIGVMDLIYENAIVTLIAAAGEGADHGLPGVSGCCPRIRQPVLTHKSCLLTGIRPPSRDIFASKWSQRAWTY